MNRAKKKGKKAAAKGTLPYSNPKITYLNNEK